MGIRLPSLNLNAKQILKRQFSFGSSSSAGNHPDVPKGHIAIYVGDQEEKKRYIVPISYVNHPSFKHLLNRAEEEFGFNHPMGALTIPCRVESFIDLTSQLNS